MNPRALIPLCLFLACAGLASEQPGPDFGYPFGTPKELPEGIRITLESDKQTYFIGENILLHYRIENIGTNPFTISVGGDYRGSRPLRFEVTAVSSDGKPVKDPAPRQFNFGGLVPEGDIKPGDSWFEKVYVLKYCLLDEPGSYNVRVFHDLGFGERRESDPRDVSITVRLVAPTVEEARAIVGAAEKESQANDDVWGRRGRARLDYFALRHPAYLPALMDRIPGAHFQDAIEGIASIGTVEATRALVGYLRESSGCSREAATKLRLRLPGAGSGPARPFWGSPEPEFPASVWEEELASPVRDFARRLLRGGVRSDIMLAASLLRRIGSPDDLPLLIDTLDYAVTRIDGEFRADLGYPPPAGACDQLSEAALQIAAGREILPRDISTPGHALLFLAQGDDIRRSHPAEYEAELAKLVRDPNPFVRAKALASLSTNVPRSLADAITERLTDTNVAVQNFAFLAAKELNEPGHRDIALAVLRESDDQWLREAASEIALKYGARYECALAWASHLDDPENEVGNNTFGVMSHLYGIVTGPWSSGGGGPLEERKTLRQRWEAFLKANQERIESGHLFRLGEDMPAALLPPGYQFHAKISPEEN